MSNTNLLMVTTLADYRTPRVHIFPSEGSLQWYIRCHKPALVDCGALVLHRGTWHAHEQRFDDFVLTAGAAAAKAQLCADA